MTNLGERMDTAMSDLMAKARAAVSAYDALSPVEKAIHDAEQRRSFVRGQTGRDPGPDVLSVEIDRLRAENAALREALAEVEAIRTGIFYWMTRNHHRGEQSYAKLAEAKERLTGAIKTSGLDFGFTYRGKIARTLAPKP